MPDATGDPPPLVPARILNEHVYCPRLAWLEWEAKAFVDNADTAEGTDLHRRVDRESGTGAELNDDHDDHERTATALLLSSTRLGVVAKLDRVEYRGDIAIPVEIKRGRPHRGNVAVW